MKKLAVLLVGQLLYAGTAFAQKQFFLVMAGLRRQRFPALVLKVCRKRQLLSVQKFKQLEHPDIVGDAEWGCGIRVMDGWKV